MDHLRGAHNVPLEVKSACLDKFLPPWTVSRKLWSDSLPAQHSGISTDVLLFSDIHLSLVHHYMIHKRGLPHIAFRKNSLSQLCALLPSPVTLPPARVVSPESSGSGSLRPVSSPEVVLGPARTMRRAHRRRRPVRVEEPAVVSVPVLTLQDPLAAVGAVVLDCRPPLLPVSIDINNVNLSAVRFPAVSTAMDGLLPSSSASRPAPDVGPPSSLAAAEQEFPWNDMGDMPESPRLQQMFRESVPKRPEQTFESLWDGRRPRQRQPPRLRQQRRHMTGLICFSCGRPGHTATRCPDFNETLPFQQPGWRMVERTGGATILPPLAVTDRRRAENDG